MKCSLLLSIFLASLMQTNGYCWYRSPIGIAWKNLVGKGGQLHLNDREIEDFEIISRKDHSINVQGVIHSQFKTDCNVVRGLLSISDINKGDIVISLPTDSCLLVDSAEYSKMKDDDESIDDTFRTVYNSIQKLPYRLALLLLNEWTKGKSSKLASYINILPFQGITPIHWNESILTDFPYQPLVFSVNIQKRNITELFSRVRKIPKFQNVSYERFLWAVESVASRAFESNDNVVMPKQKIASLISTVILLLSLVFIGNSFVIDASILEGVGAVATVFTLSQSQIFQKYILRNNDQKICVLLPFIDSANHDGVNPNCELDLISIQDRFIMKAREDIPNNTEVKISYGKKNNDQLLQYFGFVESSNMYDLYYLSDYRKKLELTASNKKEEYFETYLASRSWLGDAKGLKANSLALSKSTTLSNIISSLDENRKKKGEDQKKLLEKLFEWEKELLTFQFERFFAKHFSEESSYNNEEKKTLQCWIRTFLSSKIEILNIQLANLQAR